MSDQNPIPFPEELVHRRFGLDQRESEIEELRRLRRENREMSEVIRLLISKQPASRSAPAVANKESEKRETSSTSS